MLIRQDVICGGIIAAFGLLTIFLSYQYDIGSLTALGSGSFPALLGVILLGCGVAVLLSGIRQEHEVIDVSWRGIAFVCAGMMSFVLGIRYIGFIPALLLSSFLTCLAHPKNNYYESALISAGITVVIVLIFYVILRQPHQLFGGL